jgi:CHAT domain-containing protein
MATIEEESGGCFKLNRLTATGTLAKDLENLYGNACDVYTGMDSSKSSFYKTVAPNLDRYGAIVFATHGFAGNNIPGIMEPALALTTVPPGVDGFLTMTEVVGLKMNANVTALTACQTGMGVKLAGEGIMSMGRAFQCAGSRSVVMSLWSVEEDSSVALMNEFFKRLKAGDPKLQAWTSAKAAVRKAGYEHPFFWGAFVLVGEIK